ncbi:hypothetical protein Slin15195_G080310 [Septoria linicola]|uniref:Uncharacterized protein n=1 Tax=Septoria linicola TaxID=215465 RepID=A0A9Q9AS10_9PEZI|nr:hypothetical protein Slin14017_G041490 [Septoria linicola]USW54712.1 hypothetical protein Slin15195_G080310 [Septoria linicola]
MAIAPHLRRLAERQAASAATQSSRPPADPVVSAEQPSKLDNKTPQEQSSCRDESAEASSKTVSSPGFQREILPTTGRLLIRAARAEASRQSQDRKLVFYEGNYEAPLSNIEAILKPLGLWRRASSPLELIEQRKKEEKWDSTGVVEFFTTDPQALVVEFRGEDEYIADDDFEYTERNERDAYQIAYGACYKDVRAVW